MHRLKWRLWGVADAQHRQEATHTMGTRTRKDTDTAEDVTCLCGCLIKAVVVGGSTVHIDKGVDPHGEIGAVKVNGVWTYRSDAEAVAGAPFRYGRHRCRSTAQHDMRRAADVGDTAGPCAKCHRVQVPRRYGPNPDMFCAPCRAQQAR